ncbi:MAG: hypothetical protein MJ244_04345 [Clostridia bacterium]|nr:hypothetical protein [Clostridia bacterium]
MLININQNRIVITDKISDKEIYSTKIVDNLPSDIDIFAYKYINGELVRYKEYKDIEKSNKELTSDNNDLADYLLDMDMRLIELEYLGGSYDL